MLAVIRNLMLSSAGQSSAFTYFSPSFQWGLSEGAGSKLACIGDVTFATRVLLTELQRHDKEARALTQDAKSRSMHSTAELRSFCSEEYNLELSSESDTAIGSCLEKTATELWVVRDTCISGLESTLFILREMSEISRMVVRGDDQFRDAISSPEAEILLNIGKSHLLPLCQEVRYIISILVWSHIR